MPRRSELSVRVGLCSIVRASSEAKSGKLCGPSTKSVIALAFWAFTPGVMSTSSNLRTSCGWRTASSIEVIPPIDMPTTSCASGASWATTTATSSAMLCGV